MSVIHQICCTRCTPSHSALSAGPLQPAEPPPGHTTLRSSLDGELLRQYYPQIERYLYHPLLSDPGREENRPPSAEAAPRRFFFVPLAGGLQLMGQVCYRAGGPDRGPPSYLAHLLLRDQSTGQESEAPGRDAGWTGLDCLKLWGARGWVPPDTATLPPRLAPLESCAEMLASGVPAIDDRVFEAFLTRTEDAEELYDPAAVIPPRWRAMTPDRRRAWFAEVFAGYLRADRNGEGPLVVAAEPEVGALMFYGVLRLLPEGPLRSRIGFSTFETDPQGPHGALVATWRPDPGMAPPASHPSAWRGRVIDTREEPAAEGAAQANARYASLMIEKLCHGGWKAVDRELGHLAAAGVSQGAELGTAIAAERTVTALLETGSFSDEAWRSSAVSISAVRRELVRRVVAMEAPTAGLAGVVGGPAVFAVLDLLTTKPVAAGTRKAVVHLLANLPPPMIIGLLKLSGVSDDDKITVLARYIHDEGDLPPGCEKLWEEFAAAAEGLRRPGAILLARVLAKLPPKDLKRLYRSSPREASAGFVLNVLRLTKNNKLKLESLAAVIGVLDEAEVIELLRAPKAEVLRSYPKNEPALGEKIAELIHTLPRHPAEFKERLDLILAYRQFLPDEQHREAAAAWETCYAVMQRVATIQKPESGTSPAARIPMLLNGCRDLAKAADLAMSLEAVDQHMTWNQKRDALLRIAQEVLGGTPLLAKGPWEHEAILDRISMQLREHRWPAEPLKREPPTKKEASRRIVVPEARRLQSASWGLILGMAAAMILLTAAVGGTIWFFFFRQASTDGTERKEKPPRRGGRVREKQKAPDDLVRLVPLPDLERPAPARPAPPCGESLWSEAGLAPAILASIPGVAERRQAAQQPLVPGESPMRSILAKAASCGRTPAARPA